ncbi:MAG: pyruvate dehydrogenase (acetyl-transferring) E1 component subunit alpha [Chloroflexi bacterium RBG_19FT_COMBO_62_14]|nr:MAG: pyruvate dehydrogenase (acetyl-transferring) E1 component subunit alpha [Chloroflexi bacterium RBG_19FT_COMBO_62_14]
MERDEMLRLYHQMALIRRLEEAAASLYQEGKIGGFLHLYIGQEAVGCGVVSARRPEDRVITAYRDHGIAIAAGMEARTVLAELLGKATGCSKGKGGSMHMADVSLNFWGGHAIVGAHLPLAAGLALADKYNKTTAATICLFGDGATNIGYFHEAMNLSVVWELPVLWVCENNQYGMGTSIERASAVPEIRQKAHGYGMPNARVDGMDIVQVRKATEAALKHVRTNGPFLLEAVTYRYRGHSMGDPERYRSHEEVTKWEKNDPIGIFHKYLIKNKHATEAELEQSANQAASEIQEAVRFAEESPDPAPEVLFSDVYVKEVG